MTSHSSHHQEWIAAPAPPDGRQPVEPWSTGSTSPEKFETAMDLLCHEWWSQRLGYIVVQEADHGASADHQRRFQVKKARANLGLAPLAHIVLSEEALGRGRVCELSWNDRKMRLDIKRSRRHSTVWIEETGEEDHWDRALLEQIKDGAQWIDQQKYSLNGWQYSLKTECEAGLGQLASDETTTSPDGKTVACCMATKNRLWQLQRALPLNLLHAWPHRNWTKVHLVVCDCNERSLEWVLRNCRPAIDAGLLIVYSTDGNMPHWHACVGKNTSHMVATQDILVNVDGDNLIGRDFPVHVARLFRDGYKVLQYEHGDGTCGRIACLREDFLYIRGYDEDAYPMGGQDTDLVQRLKLLHSEQQIYKKVKNTLHSQAIRNDMVAKVACCSPKYGSLSWGRMDTVNRALFQFRRDRGQVRRNTDQPQIGVFAKRIRLT